MRVILFFNPIKLRLACANFRFCKKRLILRMQEIEDTTIDDVLYKGACDEKICAVIEKIVNKCNFDIPKVKEVVLPKEVT